MRKGGGGSTRLVRYFLIKLPVFSLASSLEEGGTVHLLLDSGSGDIAKSKNGSPLPEREAGSLFGMFSGTHRYVAIEIERTDRWIAKV